MSHSVHGVTLTREIQPDLLLLCVGPECLPFRSHLHVQWNLEARAEQLHDADDLCWCVDDLRSVAFILTEVEPLTDDLELLPNNVVECITVDNEMLSNEVVE